MSTIFTHISKIHGLTSPEKKRINLKFGKEMSQVESISNAFIKVENGQIVEIGVGKPEINDTDQVVDLMGKEVIPGLVDSHTHLVFAAPRHEEFSLRIKGASYEEIAASGGGILNSAAKLRMMSEDELFEQAYQRVLAMILQGTTCIEIKSGYGLSVDSELKILRVVKRLKAAFPIIIKATFLGAHAFPTEFKGQPDAYIDLILRDMLPAVIADELADHIDVFCDKGFFTVDQTRRILERATKFGLPSKIHGNELGLTGGVQVAVEMKSWSVDHLEHCSEVEFELLKASFLADSGYGGTMPVALPGTSYFLGIPYAPTRKMIDFGLPVVLATDFNPGSSPIHSLQNIASLACTQMKMLPEEVFNAITCNAAHSLRLGDHLGSIGVGMRADFLVMKTSDSIKTIPYFLGQNQVERIFIEGQEFFA